MNITDVWNEFKQNTREVTESSRKIAFAAAAICWFFKTDNASFPKYIQLSLVFIVLYFIFDILQFLVSVISLKKWATRKEAILLLQKMPLDSPIIKPKWITKYPYWLFLTKLIFLAAAFVFIILEFSYRT